MSDDAPRVRVILWTRGHLPASVDSPEVRMPPGQAQPQQVEVTQVDDQLADT